MIKFRAVIVIIFILSAVLGLGYALQFLVESADRYKIMVYVPVASSMIIALLSLFRKEILRFINEPQLVANLETDITKQRHGFVGRIILQNTSNGEASGVEAMIEEIYDGDRKRKIVPLPLNWMHSQLNNSAVVTRRDIYKKQPAFLDVFDYINFDTHNNVSLNPPVLRLSVLAGAEIQEWSHLKCGLTKLKITLYEGQGYTKDIWAEVEWPSQSVVPTMKVINS